MVPEVDLQVADKYWEKSSFKSESSHAGHSKVCVYVPILESKAEGQLLQSLN